MPCWTTQQTLHINVYVNAILLMQVSFIYRAFKVLDGPISVVLDDDDHF